jgi:hypothetical protein
MRERLAYLGSVTYILDVVYDKGNVEKAYIHKHSSSFFIPYW